VGGGGEQPFAAASIRPRAGHRGQLLAGLDLAEHRFRRFRVEEDPILN
jgi:hypothetical protein